MKEFAEATAEYMAQVPQCHATTLKVYRYYGRALPENQRYNDRLYSEKCDFYEITLSRNNRLGFDKTATITATRETERDRYFEPVQRYQQDSMNFDDAVHYALEFLTTPTF